MRAILENLGYRQVFRYQKYRESWRHRGQEIEIDETPIGCFLEIEGDEAVDRLERHQAHSVTR